MIMKTLFLLLLAWGSLLQGADYIFSTPDDFMRPELLTQKGKSLLVKGKTMVVAGRLIPLKKGDVITLLGTYEAVKGTPTDSVYIGFKVYDKNRNEFFYKNITPVPGSDTVLARAAGKGDKVLFIKDGSKWVKNRNVHFRTKPDLSDLPNNNILSMASSVVKEKGLWKVTLQRPLRSPLAAGIGVRQHSFSGSMSYFPAIYITNPKFSNPKNNNVKKMWDHIHFVRFIVMANWRGKKGSQLLMTNPGFRITPATSSK